MAALFLILDITGHADTWGGALAKFLEPATERAPAAQALAHPRATVLETSRRQATRETARLAWVNPGRTFALFRASDAGAAVVRVLPQQRKPRRVIERRRPSDSVPITHQHRRAAGGSPFPVNPSLSRHHDHANHRPANRTTDLPSKGGARKARHLEEHAAPVDRRHGLSEAQATGASRSWLARA